MMGGHTLTNASGGEWLGVQNSVFGYIRVLRGRVGFSGVTDPPAMGVCGTGDLGVNRYGRRG